MVMQKRDMEHERWRKRSEMLREEKISVLHRHPLDEMMRMGRR